ncbi:glycosyltransferase [Mucilaginibacter flavus]|uniref:glycosyltransferase n=1 Tax=Mucilaginibacter flavus TaxID=931504 RepID=UPI0025B33CCB|nr:glycosyltransferase [Mucilaginibacter flavus]MDN3583743.1 glycosyltransferase [Mucilaginibacter flavus]
MSNSKYEVLKSKSIALIIPDFDYGGEEKRVVNFANYYLAYFKNVYLFSPDGKSSELLSKDVKHIILNTRNPLNIISILKVIKENKIVFFQGHKRASMPFLLAAEKLLKIHSVFNFDNIYLKNNYLLKFIMPKNLIYLSDVVKSFYDKYSKGHVNIVINMGGDFYAKLDENQNNIAKRNFNIQNEFVFLSLGRLSFQKNQKKLLNALAIIKDKDFICLIVGSGPSEKELKDLVKSNGLESKVKFLGHRTDIEQLLNIGDALVQSSFFEGFPNVFIEAVSVGLPIVATNVGSSKTLIMDNGLLVDGDSTAEFSNALIDMIDNYQKYKKAAILLRESVFFKQFHKDKMLLNYLDYYNSISM